MRTLQDLYPHFFITVQFATIIFRNFKWNCYKSFSIEIFLWHNMDVLLNRKRYSCFEASTLNQNNNRFLKVYILTNRNFFRFFPNFMIFYEIFWDRQILWNDIIAKKNLFNLNFSLLILKNLLLITLNLCIFQLILKIRNINRI